MGEPENIISSLFRNARSAFPFVGDHKFYETTRVNGLVFLQKSPLFQHSNHDHIPWPRSIGMVPIALISFIIDNKISENGTSPIMMKNDHVFAEILPVN